MRPDPRILDDIARVAGGAAGVVSGLRRQIESDVRARLEELAMRMDLVPREDFERLEALLQKTIENNQALAARLDALGGRRPAAKSATKPRTKTKKK